MIHLKRRQIRLVIIIIATAVMLVAQHYHWLDRPKQIMQQNQPGLYNVTTFYDGDTIEINMNGSKEKVRFIGVDTPETHDPRKVVQCFGQAAAAFTKQLVGNNQVRLELDPLSSNRDRYNRLLRYVYLPNGTLVNLEIIVQGYGFAYTSFPFTKSDQFLQAQTTAREQTKGLWKDCQPTKNQYGGFTSNPAN